MRIPGIDLARALAVFGMVQVNFNLVFSSDAERDGFFQPLSQLLQGKAAATFVVLAGVGMALMTKRALAVGDEPTLAARRKLLLRRAAFLFVVGLLYTPLWPADILHFYGVYMAVGCLLLASSNAALLRWATCFALLFLPLVQAFDYEAGWDWSTLEYEGFWTLDGFLRNLFFNGFHPVIPWVAFLLFGMWLGRQPLHEPRTLSPLLVGSGAVFALTQVFHFFAAPALPGEWSYLLATTPMPPFPLYVVMGCSFATFLIGVSILLGRHFTQAGWMQALTATGRLALTFYVAHVVLGMGLMLDGQGALPSMSAAQSGWYALLFNLLGVAFAYGWTRRFAHGPLEWVMRRLT